MMNRPLVIFGAAFLATASAALFAPVLLLFTALPCGFALLFLRGKPRTVALILALGCLTAVAASGLYVVRLGQLRSLVGTPVGVRGSIFYENNRQMAVVTTDNGKRMVIHIFPPAYEVETGDGIVGTVQVKEVTADGGGVLLSGGMSVSCTPDMLSYNPYLNPPLAVRGMLLRERLCNRLRAASPAAATDITVAILFSVKDYLSPELRSAFSKSGMSHLLAVSGLHLSILVWTLVGAVKRFGGGRWMQAVVGICSTLFVLLAAGMTPSVFRAAFMTLLTLFAGLISRKSDGLTSLSVAAVCLVAFSPPVIADLSFVLSFTAAGGILLLAPPLLAVLERLWTARFSRCGRWARGVLSALSVSAAAQLATAPVVALQFGSLPLLGIVINLVAIPLVYPVLVFGFASCLLARLIWIPNLFSGLLGSIALFAAELPFCTLPVVFPTDLLPVIFVAVIAISAAIFPYRVRTLRRITVICTAGALLTAGINLFLACNSVIVASSSVTGSLIVSGWDGTLLIDNAQNDYHRTLDSERLSRLGAEQPDILAATYPYDSIERVEAASMYYPAAQLLGYEQLLTPTELLPGLRMRIAQPYVTEITIRNTKLMKFYAVYDTMDELDSSGMDLLLADRQGNLLSLGALHPVFRRRNGESFVRIYRNGW